MKRNVVWVRRADIGGLAVFLFGFIEAVPFRLSVFLYDMLLIDGEDGIEGWLVDAAADVGLHVEEDFVQG